jgi:hypothetical protein
MPSIEETLVAMRRKMRPLQETAMESVLAEARVVLKATEQHQQLRLAEISSELLKGRDEISKERKQMLMQVEIERAKGLAEVTREREQIARERANWDRDVEERRGWELADISLEHARNLAKVHELRAELERDVAAM